jgi:peroxisomal membrane protein 4
MEGSSASSVNEKVGQEFAAIWQGLVGGALYGVRIRLPHALVMTVLFKRHLSSKEKLRTILKLAKEHASNLAAFAALYKVFFSFHFSNSKSIPLMNIVESRN